MLVIGATLAAGLGAQTPVPVSGAEAGRVTYARSFKGSVPAFVQIAISQDGEATATVREHDADAPQTLRFTASTAAVRDIFAQAAALHEFTHPKLEAKQKVAYSGDKMLAFDDANHHSSQQFNFTTVAPAAELEARFERMATTAVDRLELERAMRFQPLNTLGVLEQIEQDLSAGRLGAPQMIEPDLEAAAANPALMDAVHHHAAGILKSLHAAQP